MIVINGIVAPEDQSSCTILTVADMLALISFRTVRAVAIRVPFDGRLVKIPG
jgi:hypothetical protein